MKNLSIKVNEFKILEIPSSKVEMGFPCYSCWNKFMVVYGNDHVYGLYGPIDDIIASIIKEFVIPILNSMKEFNILSSIVLPPKLFRHYHSGYYKHIVSIINIIIIDLYCKENKIKVSSIFGKKQRDLVPFYISILNEGLDAKTIFMLTQEFDHDVPLKIGCPEITSKRDVAFFIEKVNCLNELTGYQRKLIIDFKGNITENYFLQLVTQMDIENILFFEEPFKPNDFLAYQNLKDHLGYILACGEHCYSFLDFRNFLGLNMIDYIQPESVWCGGANEFNRIIKLALKSQTTVIPHGFGLMSNLTLSMNYTDNEIPLIEYNLLSEQCKRKFIIDNIQISKNRLSLKDCFGFGIDLLKEHKEKHLAL